MGGPKLQPCLNYNGRHEPLSAMSCGRNVGVQTELCDIQSIGATPILPLTHPPIDDAMAPIESASPRCTINVASTVPTLHLPGKVEGFSVHYLVDSGCSLNLLSKRVFDKLPGRRTGLLSPFHHRSGTLADGSELQFYGQVELTGRLRSESIGMQFVVADIESDAILGLPFLQAHNCELHCADSILIVNGVALNCTNRYGIDLTSKIQVVANVEVAPRTEQILDCHLLNRICTSLGMVEDSEADALSGLVLAATIVACSTEGRLQVRCLNPTDQLVSISAGSIIGRCISIAEDQLIEEVQVEQVSEGSAENRMIPTIPPHLETLYQGATAACSHLDERQVIAKLLNEYSDVFASGDQDMGLTDLVKHSIEVEPGARPIKQAPRRLGPEKEAEVDKQIQQLTHQGIIEPATGAWSSPVVLVKKKDGSWRFCVDYRRLNAVTVHDAHPLPRIDESLDALAGSQYFSTLDLMSGYWQVPLDEDARDKAAFCTRGGLWRWKVLPFGLTAAPATFQRLMERVMHGLHWKSLLLYLDDVIVIGKDFQDQYEHLKEVLTRLRSAGLKLKPSKCHLFQTEVRYLGHVVSKQGVATDPEKTTAIADWPIPRNVSELRGFLGTVGYYRQYVNNFASKSRPLTKLTGKHEKFQWTIECQNAFDVLKQSLLTAPVLGYPDAALEYILDTDASLEGVRAVLSQVQAGHERVISYYSRALSPAERNYCVTRRELLAVVKAVIHFRPYLYGREFRVRTDHASLLWLCRRTTPSAQIARWIEILSEFNFSIEYRAGTKHGNADGLSRRPCQDCKQCDRVSRLNGGPSMEQILVELSGKAMHGGNVSTKVTGERLYTQNGNIDCCAVNSGAVTVCDCREGHEQVCPVAPVSPGQPRQLQLEGSQSPSREQSGNIDGGNASAALSEAQKQPGDVATIYFAVESNQELQQSVVNLGSTELRKLSRMFSLMKIREDGVLIVRILVNHRSREVIICPKEMRKEVVWETHNLSHAGVMRTLRRLRLTWYWPGMTSDVRRMVKSCEICQRAKFGGLHQPVLQGPLWVGRPWQKVAIDLVGPLPVTPKGNKWILVLTDHFTRWQDAIALPDATAPMVAEALDHRVFCYFGLPEELHSDRGAQFEGDLMTELCALWRIVKTRTTAYHPQSNGVVERGNRTLGDALRSMLLQYAMEQDSWDYLLPHIMRAFRATPHTRTDETANYLMLGRECRLPDQLLEGTHSLQLTTRTRYALELKERLDSAHDLLRSHQSLPPRSAELEDELLFKQGDLVLVERKHKKKGVNPKLESKFEGPFTISKAYGNGTYKVPGKGTVNESRLKLFTPCPDTRGQPCVPPQTTDSGADNGDADSQSLDWSEFPEARVDQSLAQAGQESRLSPGNYKLGQPDRTLGRPTRARKTPGYLNEYVRY